MSGAGGVRRALLSGLVAAVSFVLAQQPCESFSIVTLEDLQAARKCPVITGSVRISYRAPDVNLDGVVAIHGNLTTWCTSPTSATGSTRCIMNNFLETISSTTLTTVGGSLEFSSSINLSNVSFPQLATVKGLFSLTDLNSLTYLDITRLESAGKIVMKADNLQTLKHETLRKITGWGLDNSRHIYIATGSLKSVDSFFQQPLEVDLVEVNSVYVKRLNYGFTKTTTLSIDASGPNPNITLVFGGPSIREVVVEAIHASFGLWSLERLPSLERLSAGSLRFYNNRCKRLDLPFNQLGALIVHHNSDLEWLSIPPKAKDWTDFSFYIYGSPLLNLTSEYAVDEKGEAVRFWYWPQSDIRYISIDANLTNDFFNSLLFDHQSTSANTTKRRVAETFLARSKTLDCTPFKTLSDQGILPSGKDFTCSDSYSSLEDGGSSGNSSDSSSGNSSDSSSGNSPDGSSEKSLGSWNGVNHWACLAWVTVCAQGIFLL
ncbi:hypothetical protein EsH8_XI_000048 [Colletotrichum jinshuiense]